MVDLVGAEALALMTDLRSLKSGILIADLRNLAGLQREVSDLVSDDSNIPTCLHIQIAVYR